MTAPIRDMAGLVRAFREAREERQITNETIDAIAGLPTRYTTKVLSPRPNRNLGQASFDGILGALGKALVLVDDPEQIPKVKNRWVKRRRIQSVVSEQASRASIADSEREMQEFKAKLALSERMKALSKLGASKGGKRRAKLMKKRARQAQASHAARKRWGKGSAKK